MRRIIIILQVIIFLLLALVYAQDNDYLTITIFPKEMLEGGVLSEDIPQGADIHLIVGRKIEVNNGIPFYPEEEKVLWAEQITTSTANKHTIIHYYQKKTDKIDEKLVHYFYIRNTANLTALCYSAECPGYYPIFRHVMVGEPKGLTKGDQFPVIACFNKIGPERTIIQSPKTIKFQSKMYDMKEWVPSMIVSIPENAVESPIKCHIDQIDNAGISMPVVFRSWIESNALIVYPYDIEFIKPITVKVRSLRKPFKQPDGKIGNIAFSINRIEPNAFYGELISTEPSNVKPITEEGWLEYQIQKGGIYYAVLWSPQKNY